MHPVKLSPDCWLCEKALYLPEEKTLIIADLHLGYEQQLRADGHNVKYEQFGKMLSLLEDLFAALPTERLVINGDLKHEHGRISGQERREVLRLLRMLKKRLDVVVIKGNHDIILEPLLKEVGITSQNSWSVNGFLCIHGDELPEQRLKQIHTIVIGHMHPSVTLHDGIRKEQAKCFLIGKYKRKRLVVVPSFFTVKAGIDVLSRPSISPLLPTTDNCQVYVVSDQIRHFGTVKKLKKLLLSL